MLREEKRGGLVTGGRGSRGYVAFEKNGRVRELVRHFRRFLNVEDLRDGGEASNESFDESG